jgi:hypothetical protein
MTTKQLHQAIRSFEEQLKAIRRKEQLVRLAQAGKADVRRIEVKETKVHAHVRAAHTRLVFARVQ